MKGDAFDAVGVSLEVQAWFAGCQVPQLDGLVGAARGHGLLVAAESDGPHPIRVAPESKRSPAGLAAKIVPFEVPNLLWTQVEVLDGQIRALLLLQGEFRLTQEVAVEPEVLDHN